MITSYDVATVRACEERAMAGLPDGALMQRAATGLAAAVAEVLGGGAARAYGARVVLLVGSGNNGGDALWAGAMLARRGARVDALLAGDRVHPEGLNALRAAGGRVRDLADGWDGVDSLLRAAHVAVDGLLGIGGRGGLRGSAARLAEALPPDLPVVAVDLPSGVDPDTGATPGPHVVAHLTVTLGVAKPCLLLPPASRAAGAVQVVDIGLDVTGCEAAVERLEDHDVAARWPVPGAADDKYRRGVLGVVAGGATYTGAAVLATGAAVRSGAGMVRYVGPQEPTDLVRSRWPEVVPGPGRVQAWLVGPGVDATDDSDAGRAQTHAVGEALASDLPVVADAGALDLLDERSPRRDAPTLLTPHAGELARLLSRLEGPVEREAVEAEPLAHARRAARRTGATVLLKGAVTLVVPPEGPARSAQDGPHWLATAGSGDVLAGVAGTLLAAGLDPLEAASLAVAAHGRAGWQASAGGPVGASDVVDAMPAAIAALLRG